MNTMLAKQPAGGTTLSPKVQRGVGPRPSVKKAASRSLKPKKAAATPRAGASPAVAAAAKRYTGAYSGALNELSDAEKRVQDTAARRQSDAKAYSAWVMGRQGAIAAAAGKMDDAATAQQGQIQGATLSNQMRLQQGLQQQRAASGIAGAVPAQQQSGLVDDQQRSQALLGAMGQQQAARANTNKGKAGFLAAAAQAGLLANQRAIAGQEFEQTSAIRREKVGVLGQRTESKIADRRAAQAAAADMAQAQIQADSAAADRASREGIANASNSTRAQIAEANIGARAVQGRANRRVRLKTATVTAQGMGYVTPAEKRRRTIAIRKVTGTQEQALANAGDYRKAKASPQQVRQMLDEDFKGLPKEVRELAIAHAFGREPGRAKKGAAKRRYDAYLKRIANGEDG